MSSGVSIGPAWELAARLRFAALWAAIALEIETAAEAAPEIVLPAIDFPPLPPKVAPAVLQRFPVRAGSPACRLAARPLHSSGAWRRRPARRPPITR